ncbi:MAG: AAA family ATPase [Lachnospiraceae bacterium]
MEITKGKIAKAQKVIVYGPEGIGKSTFAAQFPNPVFEDTEGSTYNMDVARLPKSTSWTMLLSHIDYVKQNPTICKTFIVDTIDWAEQMCVEDICAKHQKSGIEDFGYGNGYVYVREEFGRFLNKLTELIDVGINVVLTAHAQIRKFEQPDELGAYDRYELKLGKKTSSQTSPLVKEWADIVLFANYKTYSIQTDKDGKKHKAQGGSRVIFTQHHPCWDAKNRHNLPAEIPMEYAQIAHIFSDTVSFEQAAPMPTTVAQPQAEAKQEIQEPVQQTLPLDTPAPAQTEVSTAAPVSPPEPEEHIPKALQDLLITNAVTVKEVQRVAVQKGYYTEDTPIENYTKEFIDGWVIGFWPKVFEAIKLNREGFDVTHGQSTPFK